MTPARLSSPEPAGRERAGGPVDTLPQGGTRRAPPARPSGAAMRAHAAKVIALSASYLRLPPPCCPHP